MKPGSGAGQALHFGSRLDAAIAAPLVSRFRGSPVFEASSRANLGIKGTRESWTCSCDSDREIRLNRIANGGEFLDHHTRGTRAVRRHSLNCIPIQGVTEIFASAAGRTRSSLRSPPNAPARSAQVRQRTSAPLAVGTGAPSVGGRETAGITPSRRKTRPMGQVCSLPRRLVVSGQAGV